MKKKLKSTVLIGALVIPLLYSLFYLGAFWDPYSQLDRVPVAVVNLDEGAVIDGKTRELGKEICDQLEEEGSLKFIFTDGKDAQKGLDGDQYYATITIPKDFSKNVASVKKENKEVPTIEYAVNEKKNFLAAQILNMAVQRLEGEITSNLDREITVELADHLKEVPDQLGTVSSGFQELDTGTKALIDGSDGLSSGTETLVSGMGNLQSGTNGLTQATDALASGSGDLSQGMVQLQSGIDEITQKTSGLQAMKTGIDDLSQGATTLNEGLVQFKTVANGGLATYKSNVDAYVSGYQTAYQLALLSPAWTTLTPEQQAGLEALNNNAPAMESGYNEMVVQLNGGFDESIAGAGLLSGGLGTLSTQTEDLSALNGGLLQLQTGINQAAEGSNNLAAGTSLLNEKAQTMASGVNNLSAGAGKLNTGVGTLRNGLITLDNGILEGKEKLDVKIEEAKEQQGALEGMEDFAADPVNVEKNEVNYVPNYGTAFAPYFLSLSLWVGGLIIFFGLYLDVDKRYKYLCRESQNVFVRSFVYLGLALAQAVILALVIKFALGLEVEHFWTYLLSCCLVSLVFISIIQFCLVHLKDMGKFVGLFLLILQLTSCGGTFPMETVPKFFNAVYPYMPMTYSVGLFKETITGATGGNVEKDILILISMMVVFFVTTILLSLWKKKRRQQLETATAAA